MRSDQAVRGPAVERFDSLSPSAMHWYTSQALNPARVVRAAVERSSQHAAYAEGELHLKAREERLQRLALEGELALSTCKMRDDAHRIESLESEKRAQAEVIEQLQLQLAASQSSACFQEQHAARLGEEVFQAEAAAQRMQELTDTHEEERRYLLSLLHSERAEKERQRELLALQASALAEAQRATSEVTKHGEGLRCRLDQTEADARAAEVRVSQLEERLRLEQQVR